MAGIVRRRDVAARLAGITSASDPPQLVQGRPESLEPSPSLPSLPNGETVRPRLISRASNDYAYV
jgi:hypothetical protein